jgi:hypothetical protein
MALTNAPSRQVAGSALYSTISSVKRGRNFSINTSFNFQKHAGPERPVHTQQDSIITTAVAADQYQQ